MTKNPKAFAVRKWRRTPFAQRNVNVRAINPDQIREKYALSIRSGKTDKDKASGAHAARFANRAARVAWQHDSRDMPFPG